MNTLTTKKSKIIRNKNEDQKAALIQTEIVELLKRAETAVNLSREIEILLAKIQAFLKEVDDFKEKTEVNRFLKIFENLAESLDKLLQNEKLVLPPSFMNFDWQAKFFASVPRLKFEQFIGTYALGHVNKISVIKTDKTERFLLTCDIAGIAKITLIANMKEIRSLDLGSGIISADWIPAFAGMTPKSDDLPGMTSKSDDLVIFALENGNIEVWNVALRLREKFFPFSSKFNDQKIFAMSVGKDFAFCSTNSEQIYKFSLATGNVEIFAKIPRCKFSVIATSDDFCRLCAFTPGKIYLWELPEFTSAIIINTGGTEIRAMSFNPSGTKIICTTNDGSSKVWSILGSFLNEIKFNEFQILTSVMMSSDLGAAITENAELIVFDINDFRKTYSVLGKLSSAGRTLEYLAVDSEHYLIAGDGSGNLTVFKTSDFKKWVSVKSSDFIIASCLLKSGNILQVFSSGLFKVIDLSGNVVKEQNLIQKALTTASVAIDAGRIVVGTDQGYFYVVDANKLTVIHNVREIAEKITAIGISNDGSKIIIGYESGELQLYNGETAERYNVKFPRFNKAVKILSINKKGSFAVVGEQTGFMSIISLPQGEVVKNIWTINQDIEFVKYSENEEEILISTVNKKNLAEVLVYNIEKGKHEVLLTDFEEPIKHFNIFSDKDLLISLKNGETRLYRKLALFETLSLKKLSDYVLDSVILSGALAKKFMSNWNIEDSALIITTRRGITAIYSFK